MKVIIQGKHLQLTEGMKTYATEHIVEPLQRFLDDPAAELRIELGDQNGTKGGVDKECHLTLRLPNANAIQIEEVTADAYASMDMAADRLLRAAKRELARQRTPSGRHKEHPLATVVAEGGVPGGLVEELPNGSVESALAASPNDPDGGIPG